MIYSVIYFPQMTSQTKYTSGYSTEFDIYTLLMGQFSYGKNITTVK